MDRVAKVYMVIDVTRSETTPTEQQWQALIDATKTQPMTQAMLKKGRQKGRGSQNKVTLNVYEAGNQRVLGDVEFAWQDSRELLETLRVLCRDAEPQITGTAREKFQELLQREVRAAAVDAGYDALAADIDFLVIGWSGSGRKAAIDEARAWVAANWTFPEEP